MAHCIFCTKTGESLLCENSLAKAFYDNFPVNEGHTLVVPKRHVASYFEASAEELAAMNELIFTVKELLDEKYQPAGYNVGVNVGEAAGQSVFHFHVHVMPRFVGDVKNPRGGVRKIKKSVVPYPLEEENSEQVYNKLVRDKIPTIIEKSGKVPVCHVADEEEYARVLKEKLWEEVREFSGSGEAEELADILEVIKGLAANQGRDWEEITSMAEAKANERGRFRERFVLERVKDLE